MVIVVAPSACLVALAVDGHLVGEIVRLDRYQLFVRFEAGIIRSVDERDRAVNSAGDHEDDP